MISLALSALIGSAESACTISSACNNQFENEAKLQIPATCQAMDQAAQVLVI